MFAFMLLFQSITVLFVSSNNYIYALKLRFPFLWCSMRAAFIETARQTRLSSKPP